MKRILKKLLICILILFILNNFIIGNFPNNISYAGESKAEELLVDLLGTVVGLLTWPMRLVAMALGMAVNTLMGTVAYIEGGVSETGKVIESGVKTLVPFDVLFNRINLLNINFFDFNTLSNDSILYKFRTSIALWYYMMRNIAVAILLCVLVYVGIRMALSTVSAEQKASYKKMLVDWVVSLAIIFLLQYIILFTIYVNNALVKAISSVDSVVDASAAIDDLAKMSLGIDISAIAATVVYCLLAFQTFGLFISYFNRMLKLSFLVIISPLITLTYSIDKMGDGKAQALNTWLKEYVYTILIQPFHCIIYMTFVSITFKTLSDTTSGGLTVVANAVIAILCINFIKEGEKIVRKIFNFADENSNTSLTAGLAVATMAASRAKNIGKSTRKAVNGVRNFKTNAGNALSDAKIGFIAARRYLSNNGGTNESGEKQSYSDVKSEVRAEQYNKKADKEEKKYTVNSEESKAMAQTIKDRTDMLMKNGMSKKEAKARARLSVAQETRKAKKKDNFEKNHPRIASARGKISKVKEIANESETLKLLGGYAKSIAPAGGLALFVGAGSYAGDGSLTKAVLAGKAAYTGTKEFMKTSSKTLQTDVQKRLASLGIADKQGAMLKMNNLAINGSQYEDPDEMKKLLKEIEKALEKAGLNPKMKENISYTIQKMMAENPSASVGSIVNHAFAANGISPESITSELRTATVNYANFNQEKSIYETIKTSGDIGISPDKFIQDVVKSYQGIGSSNTSVSSNGNSKNVSDSEFIENAVNITASQEGKEDRFEAPDNESVQRFIQDRTDEEIQDFYKKCQREIFETMDKVTSENNEEQKEKLIARVNQIEAARAKVQDAALDRAIDRLTKQAQETIDRATSATEKEAQSMVDNELSILQKDYNNCINQANQHLTRKQMDGIKDSDTIKSQISEMNKQLGEIKEKRDNFRNANLGGKL